MGSPIGERQVSETMNLHQVPETMTLHRALWAGRIMSAFVVIALVADGTIQLFRAGTDREHVAGNRVRDGPDPRRGTDPTRLRHPLRHSGHRRLRRDPSDGLFGRC